MKIKGLALVGFLTLPTTSFAEFLSGNDLMQYLTTHDRAVRDGSRGSAQEAFDSGKGQGFVLGVFDVGVGVSFCSPGAVTAGQVVAIAYRFLQNNPERLHQTAESLVTEALRKAFPCKR